MTWTQGGNGEFDASGSTALGDVEKGQKKGEEDENDEEEEKENGEEEEEDMQRKKMRTRKEEEEEEDGTGKKRWNGLLKAAQPTKDRAEIATLVNFLESFLLKDSTLLLLEGALSSELRTHYMLTSC